MTPDAVARAADLLHSARRDRRAITALPEDCRPADEAAAYRVQDALVARLSAGHRPLGYKIGATSQRAQDFLGLTGPFFGRILAAGLRQSPAEVAAGDFVFRLIEPEFAFRLDAALAPRTAAFTEDEVGAAVGAVLPAIEIVASSFGEAWTSVGAPSLIADNGVHGGWVMGTPRENWRDIDLPNHPVSLAVNGAQVGSGRGANALGGPLTALTWLANRLRAAGRGLAVNDLVTTGVVTEFVLVGAGDEVLADYGSLGQVRLRFTA